jgi:hypothetical protein
MHSLSVRAYPFVSDDGRDQEFVASFGTKSAVNSLFLVASFGCFFHLIVFYC